MFIGRTRELATLDALYQEDKFQLFILYGRRRVGKTTFLNEFCKNKKHIFYSAEQSSDKMNLDKFSSIIFSHYKENNLENFSSWENALLYINEKQQKEPLVLVLDEFPYLANLNRALLSQLQHLIDKVLQHGKLFIVLCGSYMSFMEQEVLGQKSPLFGRRTGQLQLKPFDYLDSSKFLTGFTQEEKCMLYAAFGGTPLYLLQAKKVKTVKQNITASFLDPLGYLYEEPLFLLKQEVREPGLYNAIIETIAIGATKTNEIATKTGEEAAKCLKYIKVLRDLGIVAANIPFGEKNSSRRTIYSITDFMFRFYYRYVLQNKSLLETGAQNIVWERRIEPDYSQYMGLAFERICKEYLLRENAKGNLPILFTEIGNWWGPNPYSPQHEQIEIDIVAKDGNKYIYGECKWRNELLDLSVLVKLKEKVGVIAKKNTEIYYALFSKSGFTKAVLEEAKHDDHLLLIDLSKIMKG